jgi:uncharacterized protein (DUF362 family)
MTQAHCFPQDRHGEAWTPALSRRQGAFEMTPNATVAIIVDTREAAYPEKPPFNPPAHYPEYPFETECDPTNSAYRLVRDTLIALRLDEKNMGTKAWNPLGGIVSPGGTVLIKPNLVKHFHNTGKSIHSVIVHGSVIRAVADYVWIALAGRGRIVIADTPIEKADFAKICELNGLSETVAFLGSVCAVPIDLVDLRSYWTHLDRAGQVASEEPLAGDSLGYVSVDVGIDSELCELDGPQTNYHTLGDHTVDHYNPCTVERGLPNQYHNPQRHIYGIGRTVLNADTVISVAKLKTHKKAGVTLNLKNMIGVVNGKAFIPHHRPGPAPQGDSFPVCPPKTFVAKRYVRQAGVRMLARSDGLYSFAHWVVRAGRKLLHFTPKGYTEWGEWYGNDTIWRTILDVNRILLYADKSGKIREARQRRYFCFVDGIVGMEGDGPMGGDPVRAGVVLAGSDPVAVDAVATQIMGFDPAKVPTIHNAGRPGKFELGTSEFRRIKVVTKDEMALSASLGFKAAPGWAGHIERGGEPGPEGPNQGRCHA